ncbi:hypothetical protein ACGFNV_35885 [Streptomyces sp. NPDC048751]
MLNNAAAQFVTDSFDPAEGLELDDVLIGYTVPVCGAPVAE